MPRSGQLKQDERIGSFDTPLGKDALVLTRFDGSEGVSRLFEYRVEALSEQQNINFNAAIGQNCSISFKTYEQPERHFNGTLIEAQWVGVRETYFAYQLTLRPWLWMLSQTADCRIFKDKTVIDIIKDVFGEYKFAKFKDRCSESYPKLEYCVQYRETDLDFVTRLMELHGIYYFFEHTKDQHELILADARSSHKPTPRGKVEYAPLVDRDRRTKEHVYHWVPERRFRTGKVEFNEYDYLKPTASMKAQGQAAEGYENANLEVYDYPGKYKEVDVGRKQAEVRLQAAQSLDYRRHAAGDAISLFPGGLTKLEKHPSTEENEEYLVVQATHAFVTEFYRSGPGTEPDEIYYGHYEFQPSKRPFRAPLITPKPLVHGPQTAKVVGKEGEEIDVDEHGRILVQFHWDRDKKPSRRVRVAQVWSGKKWGGQIIPRIGQEVVVEFLEGDPDRPLVIGTVYNNDYKFPYDLPANKTKSGLKSDSSKGGGGYNEFMFEDKKGEEKIGLHAQKDHDVVVRHQETQEIGQDFGMGKARSVTIKNGDDFLKVATGSQKVDVCQEIEIKAGLKITLVVGESKITIDPMGITITSMKTEVKGTATVMVSAPMITIG